MALRVKTDDCDIAADAQAGPCRRKVDLTAQDHIGVVGTGEKRIYCLKGTVAS